MRGLRTDIQVLRAFAVLSVLIFHFEMPWLKKGFLGVDIFFVISGYLMSGVIVAEMDTGRFNTGFFYLRRARRLLPAAFATLLLTTAIAPFVLTPSLLSDYVRQLLGALTFSANAVLWAQSGYFDGAAHVKPLLHMWSLALEEQFYFLLPLVLAIAGRGRRLPVLLVLFTGSLAGSMWWQSRDPSGTFYLLHTRAWELLIGSLCALPGLGARLRLPFDSGWVALPAMGFALTHGMDPVHPRGDALLVCAATALLIASPSAALQSTHAWTRPLHWIGDRSYSLYLVHWPLIALSRSVWLEGVPLAVDAGLLVVSFALAHASYTWIEQPTRHMDSARDLALRLSWLGVPLLMASGALWLGMQPSRSIDKVKAWQHALRPNYGLARACDHERDYKPRPQCESAPRPRTLLWGDSYAMHLVPALLAASPAGGIAQATRSACAPLLDMARRMPNEPASRAKRCLSFNASVLHHLAKAPHVEYVVISARWQYLLEDPAFDANGRQIKPTPGLLAESLAATVRQLHKLGKKVLIVSPPASLGADINLGLCRERRALGLWTVTPSLDASCGFTRSDHVRHNGAVRDMLQAASQTAGSGGAPLLDLDAFTCQATRCTASWRGKPLYRDAGHLSHDGSRMLGLDIGLAEIIAKQAR